MKVSPIIAVIISSLFSLSITGQETADSSKTKTQVTFAYPIGSNGAEAKNMENNFSFNILYGVNGELNGLEFGTLVNVVKGNANGFQFVGLTNVVEGAFYGVQFAGINNVIQDSLIGMQFSGISNLVPEQTVGAQIAGITNFTKNELSGTQISGISNFASKRIKGAQITGISNVANGKCEGAQIAGIHNLTTGNLTGAQIAGLYNQTQDTLRGAQIGLVNSAHVMHGFQLGLINVADSSTGVSVGLLSLIKNGYHAVELYTNEVLPANAAIKIGTDQFYNIYQGGFDYENPHLFGFGMGFGTKLRLADWISISADLTANHINELEKFEWKVNLLSRADLTFDLHLNQHIGLTFGPSLNAHISELGYESTGGFTTDIAVNPFFTDSYNGYQLQMWIGAKGGLRITF
ncbi:MAG: LA_2272 family surface repeat-containing protein [Salibacteraceae bacterium]